MGWLVSWLVGLLVIYSWLCHRLVGHWSVVRAWLLVILLDGWLLSCVKWSACERGRGVIHSFIGWSLVVWVCAVWLLVCGVWCGV